MFSLATGLYQFYFTPSSISLLIIGCDGVGKTALLERCKITKFSQRRFAPSSVAANCRSGRVGRSRASINSNESSKQEQPRPKQPLQQRRQHDLTEAINMDKIRPTGTHFYFVVLEHSRVHNMFFFFVQKTTLTLKADVIFLFLKFTCLIF